MLLVVVMLLLISMIGMSYLQVSRLDRAAASTSSSNYIDVVANSSITYIGEVLKNDLIASDNTLLNPAMGIEAYDYPWTDDNQSFAVQYNDGTGATAKGGQGDDTWLASIEPDFVSDKGTWPHITNLNGTFLRLPSASSSHTAPEELAVDNLTGSYQWRRDTQVPINVSTANTNLNVAESGFDVLGADADGDGINDSKWTWAPIRQVSGISYVMAVRIIDNSALLNMNVALSQVNSVDTYASNIPNWQYPSELDLGNFVYKMGGSTSELKKTLAYRLNTNTTSMSLPIDETLRLDFWELGASYYDSYQSGYKKLGILNELELRYRNGLNNSDITALLENTSNGMASFLRANSTETTYLSVPNVTQLNHYFEKEPRHQLTTVSGAASHRPLLPNDAANAATAKYDVNNLLTASNNSVPNTATAQLEWLSQLISDVFANPSAAPATPTTGAQQLTVNLADYADQDNLITHYYDSSTSAYNTVYGMEALPFISEVYTQRSYKMTVNQNNANNGNGKNGNGKNGKGKKGNGKKGNGKNGNGNGNNTPTVTATATANDTPGFAIEIRNPFPNSIILTDVYLWIGSDSTGSYEISLDTLVGETLAIANGAVTSQEKASAVYRVLQPDQILVIYHDSVDQDNSNDSDHEISRLINTGPNVVTYHVTNSNLDDVLLVNNDSDKSADFSVQLRATKQDGSKLTWGYSKVLIDQFVKQQADLNLDDVLLTNYSKNALDGHLMFTQKSNYVQARGLNALAYPSSQWQTAANTHERDITQINTSYSGKSDYLTLLDRLGDHDKTVDAQQSLNASQTTDTGFAGTDIFDPTTDLWYIPNRTLLTHVGEMALIPIVGMQNGKTLADTFNLSSSRTLASYMLDIQSSSYVSTSSDSAYFNTNHTQALMEQFVTLSPYEDTVDNDSDGTTDEADERFIPGTININTASQQLLNQILPIENVTTRAQVVSQIIAARGSTGISLLSHIYDLNSANWGYSSSDQEINTRVQRDLTGVSSTRSDIFTAFVLIRGYPSGDFRKGAVESRRYFVVFDRSKITNNNDHMQILGYYEF